MASNGKPKNKKSEEKTRYTRDDGDITLEIDEEEINNLLYFPDSEPKCSYHLRRLPTTPRSAGRRAPLSPTVTR